MKFLYHLVNYLLTIRFLAVYAGVKEQSMPVSVTVSLDFVSQHNLFRQQLKTTGSNVECVKGTNSLLKNIAQRYADRCTTNKPSPQDLSFSCYSKVGLAVHYDTRLLSPADVVADLLLTYSDYYDFSFKKCVINGWQCDSFLQASWSRMNEIGCGRTKCKSVEDGVTSAPGYITVCAYSEAPSPSVPPYSPGTPCTTCPESKNMCINKLCCGAQNTCTVSVDNTTSTSTTSTTSSTSTTPTTTTTTTTTGPSTITAKTSLSPCVDEAVCSTIGQSLCDQRPGTFLSQCRKSCENCFDEKCYDSKDPRVNCKELSKLCPTPTKPNALVKSYCPKTCGICQ